LLARLRRCARQAGRSGRLIEILALQGCVLLRQGERQAALQALEECLALALPEGYVRVFIDEGEPMKELLQVAGLRLKDVNLRKYIGRLLMSFEPGLATRLEHEARRLQRNPPSVQGRQLSTFNLQPSTKKEPSTLIEPLSERELDVLRLIAAGLSNQEIARELIVAPSTIHWHTKNIYSKMNVHSRTQASWQARQLGLVG
jgi:LuxR family maltose regulon positive regulatory protein